MLTNVAKSNTDTPAFVLALLTAGGGITGYIRTGSVPSIAAGVTVGALVIRFSYVFSASPACAAQLNNSPSLFLRILRIVAWYYPTVTNPAPTFELY